MYWGAQEGQYDEAQAAHKYLHSCLQDVNMCARWMLGLKGGHVLQQWP